MDRGASHCLKSPRWTRTGSYIQPMCKGPAGKPLTFRNQRGMSVCLMWRPDCDEAQIAGAPWASFGLSVKWGNDLCSARRQGAIQMTAGELFLPWDLWFCEQARLTPRVLVTGNFGGNKKFKAIFRSINCRLFGRKAIPLEDPFYTLHKEVDKKLIFTYAESFKLYLLFFPL